MYTLPTETQVSNNSLTDSTLISNLSVVVADDGTLLFSQDDLVTLYDDQENVIGYIIYVSTTEQFVKLSGYNLVLNSPLYIKIKNNLYFQNDIRYREGFINNFYWFLRGNGSTGSIYIQANDDLDEVILQGIQVTGVCFFYFDAGAATGASQRVFKNIYFKDCVFTKVQSDTWAFKSTPITSRTYGTRFLFENCKISIHMRVGEYGYFFDYENGIAWKNCSRYIEYSDVDTENIPYEIGGTQFWYYGAETTNCATIIRNVALKIRTQESGIKRFAKKTINSSWDVELYKLVYTQQTSDWNEKYSIHFSTNNCFVSVKIDEIIQTEGENVPANQVMFDTGIFGPNTIGVNIFNKGDVGQTNAATCAYNANVAQLTDTECHDYNKLNQYGFFVNRAYDFELLTEEPDDWAENYNAYFIKVGQSYTINNSSIWAENTYYQKVYL